MAQRDGEIKPTLQWAEHKLRMLSEEGFTGTVTIRFSQGGVQSMVLNQELQPNKEVQSDVREVSRAAGLRKA